MKSEDIRRGSILRGPKWAEPVEINLIEETGNYIHIIGVTTISRNHVDQIISPDELSSLSIESQGTLFSEDHWKVFLMHFISRVSF